MTAGSTRQQAIAAAAAVLHDEYCSDGDTKTCGRWNCKLPGGYDPQKHIGYYEDRAQEVLAAVEPLIRADQRERDARLADQHEAYTTGHDEHDRCRRVTHAPFADLLRAQP